MKLRFTPRATENIGAVADFLMARNQAAAARVQTDIYTCLQSLLLFPNVGRQQHAKGVRKIVTKGYSYLIYYIPDEEHDEVVVLNIKHPAQEREHSDL